MFSYRREIVLQGALALAKSGRMELGDNIYKSIFNYCNIIGLQLKAIEFGEKNAKIIKASRRSKSLKVIEVGIYQSKARMRLPVSD